MRDIEEVKLVGLGDRSAKQWGVRVRAVLKISDLLSWRDSIHHNRKHCALNKFTWGTGDAVLNILV